MSRGVPPLSLFFRLRLRLLGNHLRSMLHRSRLRLSVIAILSVVIWGGLYHLFGLGIRFIQSLDRAGPELPGAYSFFEALFGTFFLALIGLMVFSNGLLMYASLFRSAETSFLLTAPVSAARVFAHKFQESMFLTGWAFLLLGSPLLVAYGVMSRSDWTYYVLLLPYLLGFMFLPAAIGAAACLLIAATAPRQPKLVLAGLLTLLAAGLSAWAYSATRVPAGVVDPTIGGVRQLFAHLHFTQHPLLPSRWMTHGIMDAARGNTFNSLFDLLLIWGCGIGFYAIGRVMAAVLYRSAYGAIHSAGGPPRKYLEHWSDRLAAGLLAWTSGQTRALILKDFRAFRRDPLQWAQVLILGGFLLVYFLSIPYLPHGRYSEYARTRIGLLNMAVIGLMLATFTSRFVFPLMSLEGRNFWVLGLAPVDRKRLVMSKFAFSSVLTLTTSCGLTLVSGLMLRLTGWSIGVELLGMGLLSLGLPALSVGLGSYLVNVSESNPSKVATGYAGTVNLLLSLGLALAMVVLAGMATFAPYAVEFLRMDAHAERMAVIGVCTAAAVLMVVIGLAAIFFPLRMGVAALRRMEF